jgi:hypothetical protein
MFVYQPDAKLKRGFDFLSGDFSRFAGLRTQIVQIRQSMGVGLGDPMIGQRCRQQRWHGVDRPRRSVQSGPEPIFDRLIAQHHDVAMRQSATRPTAQRTAERTNRPPLRRVVPFDPFLLRQIGENILSIERHCNEDSTKKAFKSYEGFPSSVLPTFAALAPLREILRDSVAAS